MTQKIHYSWWIVVACCAIMCCTGITVFCAGNFFQPVASELQVGIGKVTLYLTVVSVTMALLCPMVSKLLETHLKSVLLFGGICQYAAFGAMSQYHSVYGFYLSGIFLGIGSAVTMYMAVPILLNMWFQKNLAQQWELLCHSPEFQVLFSVRLPAF